MNDPRAKTPTSRIALAWAIVLIPLGWGVFQSLVKSLPLFRNTASASSPLVPGISGGKPN